VFEISDQGLREESVSLEQPCRLFTRTNLLTSERIVLPSDQFLLDAVNFGTKLTSKLLVHDSRLLRIGRQKGLGENFLDVPLNEGRQIRRQDARKVAGDIWPKEEFLDLDGQSLIKATSKRQGYLAMSRRGLTCWILSDMPLPTWSFKAAFTSFFVIFSNDGRTEFCTSFLTAISTTRVVFLVNSVEISLRIFS
jgi:hypothetical protein